MFKLNWWRAAAVITALFLVRTVQPVKAESVRTLLGEWLDPNTGLQETVAKGEKLEAAVVDRMSSWFSRATAVITDAPINADIKAAALRAAGVPAAGAEEARRAAEAETAPPTAAIPQQEAVVPVEPTSDPYGPPPEYETGDRGRWVGKNLPDHTPSAGDVYTRMEKRQISATRGEVRDYSMWKYMRPAADGKHILYDATDSKKEITVSDEELKDDFRLLEIANPIEPEMGGRRKTRRARGKKRRTVKRRAKSLRRRRQ